MPTVKKTLNGVAKSSKTKKSEKYFTGQARLTKGQRKYCACLMHVRAKGLNPYGICRASILKAKAKAVSKDKNQYKGDTMFKGNCTMSYNYDKYTDAEIKALAKEKKITLSYKDRNTGKRRLYSRDKLVEKITKLEIARLTKKKTNDNK